MKNMLFLTAILLAILPFLSGCSPGYVAQEPTYSEMARPNRPSTNHVWVDGGWHYDRRNRAYVHDDGQWVRPNQGRSYHDGQWKQDRRGYHWAPGRWR